MQQPSRRRWRHGDRGIRANAIAPGPVSTDPGGGMLGEFEALHAGQTALDRLGEPDDVGCLIARLPADDHRRVNAQTIEAYRI
ncbi:SDR family oxidoreductase [Paroceanicella profunda]|nr:SDR family oxidoreductase [Paroceanicella profunda]